MSIENTINMLVNASEQDIERFQKLIQRTDELSDKCEDMIGTSKIPLWLVMIGSIVAAIALDYIIYHIVTINGLWVQLGFLAPLFITAAIAVVGVVIGGLLPATTTTIRSTDSILQLFSHSRNQYISFHSALIQAKTRLEEEIRNTDAPRQKRKALDFVKLVITDLRERTDALSEAHEALLLTSAEIPHLTIQVLTGSFIVLAIQAVCLLLCVGPYAYLAAAITMITFLAITAISTSLISHFIRLTPLSQIAREVSKIAQLELYEEASTRQGN